MILYVAVDIHNPFTTNEFDNLWCGAWNLTKNKTLEAEVFHHNTLIGFHLDIRFWGQDHAGPSISLALFNYEFSIGIHDNRHWDHDKNDWEVYD